MTLPKKMYLPERIQLPLSYRRYTNIANQGSTPYRQLIIANDPYDPEWEWNNSSSQAFKAYSALYGRYYVTGASITVTVTNNSTQPINFGIIPTIQHDLDNTIYPLDLQPNIRSVTVPPAGAYYNVTNTTTYPMLGQSRTLKIYRSTKRIYKGLTVTPVTNLGANTTTRPQSPWYFHIVVYMPQGVSSPTFNFSIKTTLWSYTTFSQRKNIPMEAYVGNNEISDYPIVGPPAINPSGTNPPVDFWEEHVLPTIPP